jgi:dethiobiotin synthetase
MRGLFVTGTDTGVGKTHVARGLLLALRDAGVRAIGMKPVSAGVEPQEPVNADVVALESASDVDAPLRERNPYAFTEAVAPHVAALAQGVLIEVPIIEDAAHGLARRADALIVEGAGGALVPLNDRHDMLDIPLRLELPVLLVVGMRLGCISHAMLSALAIRRRGLVLAGWVANVLPPSMSRLDENVSTLVARLGIAPVAVIPAGANAAFDAHALRRLGF